MKHGVQTALEYVRTGNLERGGSLSNPDPSPYIPSIDVGGHGYSVVRAGKTLSKPSSSCIGRPIAPAADPEGGPLRYRVVHRVSAWAAGERSP